MKPKLTLDRSNKPQTSGTMTNKRTASETLALANNTFTFMTIHVQNVASNGQETNRTM